MGRPRRGAPEPRPRQGPGLQRAALRREAPRGRPLTAPPSPARSAGLLEANLAVLLFGLAGLFGKLLELSPVLIVLGRVLFASLALGLVALLRGTSLGPGSARSYAVLAGSGLLLAFHWTTFFQSIQVSTVAIGLVSFATFPLFVTFLEPLFGAGPLRLRPLLLALATLAGAALVALGPALGGGLFGAGPAGPAAAASGTGAPVAVAPGAEAGRALAGVLWGLASAASFALLSLLNKRSAARLSSLAVAFHQDLVAALALGIVLLATGGAALPTPRELGLLAILGILCTALAHSLFIASLRGIRARTAALLGSLEPLYGALFALLLLGELPGAWTLAGGAIILGAALLAAREGAGGAVDAGADSS